MLRIDTMVSIDFIDMIRTHWHLRTVVKITSLTIVYSTVYSGAVQRKHQSSTPLTFVRGIHQWPVNSPHKWPVTRKMFPFDDAIMHFHNAHHHAVLYSIKRPTVHIWWRRIIMHDRAYWCKLGIYIFICYRIEWYLNVCARHTLVHPSE